MNFNPVTFEEWVDRHYSDLIVGSSVYKEMKDAWDSSVTNQLYVLLKIRDTIGDKKAKLNQDELVDAIKILYESFINNCKEDFFPSYSLGETLSCAYCGSPNQEHTEKCMYSRLSKGKF